MGDLFSPARTRIISINMNNREVFFFLSSFREFEKERFSLRLICHRYFRDPPPQKKEVLLSLRKENTCMRCWHIPLPSFFLIL